MPSEPIPSLSYDPETDRVGDAPDVPPEMLAVAGEFGGRYRLSAATLVDGLGETLHVAFDPSLVASEGRAPRHICIAASAPNLADHISAAADREVGPVDLIVTMGPGFVAWDGDETRLREVVASDLGFALGKLYPAFGQGTLERLMPWLLQMSMEIVAFGPSDPAGAHERGERSAARAFNGVALAHYPSWNAHGQLLTDHPAWPFLAEETVKEAKATAATSFSPAPPDVIAKLAHGALLRALTNLGVPVRPASAAPDKDA